MLKTVKSKVIAGTVAVTLFAGAGAAFGASDAGTFLKDWWNVQLEGEKQDLATNVKNYQGKQEKFATGKYSELRKEAGKTIAASGETAESKASTNINNQLDQYTGQISGQEAEIKMWLNSYFDQYLVDGKQEIANIKEQGKTRATKDIKNFTGREGTKALNTLTSELNDETEIAVDKLELAIANAKSSILKDLSNKTTLTETHLKEAIDFKVTELLDEMATITKNFVEAQEDLINKRATELENKALDDMEEIVKAIDDVVVPN